MRRPLSTAVRPGGWCRPQVPAPPAMRRARAPWHVVGVIGRHNGNHELVRHASLEAHQRWWDAMASESLPELVARDAGHAGSPFRSAGRAPSEHARRDPRAPLAHRWGRRVPRLPARGDGPELRSAGITKTTARWRQCCAPSRCSSRATRRPFGRGARPHRQRVISRSSFEDSGTSSPSNSNPPTDRRRASSPKAVAGLLGQSSHDLVVRRRCRRILTARESAALPRSEVHARPRRSPRTRATLPS